MTLSVRNAVALTAVVIAVGCSSTNSPTAPTAVATTRNPNIERLVATASADTSGAAMDRVVSAIFDTAAIGPAAVTFPPRNEPAQFRSALENKYRDTLRRSPTPTYVDQEGTVVWTQEYLRYRVGLCSHADAVSKVMAQIDGRGIGPECGTTNVATFPPRNEPLAFMVELEAKYRDGIRRPAVTSYVDVEGNVIWTQEYLRYRVSGCTHASAQQKVFDQIDGRGVQADCTPVVVVTPTPTARVRVGATCNDGSASSATGSGACSSHGGVRCWRYSEGTCTNP